MKLSYILLSVLVTIVILFLSIIVFFGNQENTISNAQHDKFGSLSSTKKADDPTYSQEIRALTAKLKLTQDSLRERELRRDNKTAQLQDTIDQFKNELSNVSNSDDSKKIEKMIKDISTEKESLSKENQELKKQLNVITESLNEIKTQQGEKDEEVASLRETVMSVFNKGQKVERPDSSSTVETITTQGIDISAQGTVSHKPYGVIYDPEGKGSDLGKLINGLTGVSDKATDTLFNQQQIAAEKKVKPLTSFPVYTLPMTTMLTDSKLLTPLIGRVPFGGNVNDPFKFQLEIGAENLVANGHRIPGVSKAVASGISTGVREQSCVRATITTMTFVFEDGRISTTNVGSGNTASGGIGYLADPYGKPCIRGEYINNAGDYLKGRSAAAFLEGLANAYSSAQVKRTENSNGTMSSFISGNTYQFAAAQGVANTASEIASYVRERAMDAFDVVYVPQALDVQVILTKQVNIDYDLKSRKTSYVNDYKENNNYD